MKTVNRTTTAATLLAWLLATGLFAALAPPSRAEPAADPVAVLREVTEYLQDIVRRDTSILQDPVRLRALAYDVVLPHVDFVTLSRWVLGRHWRTATPAQREAFMVQFREMLLLNYINRVTNYRETAVRFLPPRSGQREDLVVVQAEVEPEGGPVVDVQFRMHRVDGRWLIYDVTVEGISLVATHRSGFTQEISRHGMDGLIAMLADRNREAAARTAAGVCEGC